VRGRSHETSFGRGGETCLDAYSGGVASGDLSRRRPGLARRDGQAPAVTVHSIVSRRRQYIEDDVIAIPDRELILALYEELTAAAAACASPPLGGGVVPQGGITRLALWAFWGRFCVSSPGGED